MKREDDHLNRWPLAREIYGIATTGPKDWSVRIGIYGEWGTGKTSVLEFITSMAQHDKQILIRFNPWQHSTKDALWRAFVLAIFSEPALADVAGGKKARAKGWFSGILKRADVVKSGTSLINDKVGEGVGVGLELVKSFFAFSEKDLKSLRDTLGDKRVIVLVDDLDRTAPELVPEILFALKELMNIPGFSFICAFDPVVVGQVLGDFHPGFGDGLKFLEKIIDYPRWLPPPPPEGLAALAVADAKRYCRYVPEPELREAIELLPPNPRAVRQFIRLLALLAPQIKRHDEDELRWPAILAANVIKVRYPRRAHALLNDLDFWRGIETVTILDRSEEKAQLTEAVKNHVEAVNASQNTQLNDTEKAEVVRIMMPLCSNIMLWFGGGAEVQVYQMNIAEAPHAVTGKEFSEFCATWDRDPSANNATTRITAHAVKVERPKIDVYQDLLSAALKRYPAILRNADQVRRVEERPPLLKQAEALIAMIECLVLDLGQIDQPAKQIGPAQIEAVFEAVADILKASHQPTGALCQRNEALLRRVIERWQGDVAPLIAVILPYGHWGTGRFDGPSARALHQRLSAAVLPKLAAQVIAGFRQPGYVQRIWHQDRDGLQIRCLLYAHDGPLWQGARNELLATLREAVTNQAVRENAYELLHWFDHVLGERGDAGDASNLKQVLLDKPLLDAVWSAATAKPLSPPWAVGLNQFVLRLKPMGASVELPVWWDDAIKQRSPKPALVSQPGAGNPETEADQPS